MRCYRNTHERGPTMGGRGGCSREAISKQSTKEEQELTSKIK